jgi:hypothetical protein
MRSAITGLVLVAVVGCRAVTEAPPRDLVVLVHGMGRTRLSMLPLERMLEREGYDVLNWGYPSTDGGVAELGASLAGAVGERPRAAGTHVHFVGHSLGNILVRWVLANRQPPDVGRVVMLAPPNQGARAAAVAAPWVGWLLDPLADLVPGGAGAALALPAGAEVGVIAGEYDGKVSLDESHLAGETAHVAVPAMHSFLMYRKDVQRLTLEFLREGRFTAP